MNEETERRLFQGVGGEPMRLRILRGLQEVSALRDEARPVDEVLEALVRVVSDVAWWCGAYRAPPDSGGKIEADGVD